MDFATEGEARDVLLHWLNTEQPGQSPRNADTGRWSIGATLAFAFGTSGALWGTVYLCFALLNAAR
jgi:hypothetical protein